MLMGIDPLTKKILEGNVLLIICSLFYLAWWIIAFQPVGGHGSLRTRLLLGGAVITGIAAIWIIVRGLMDAAPGQSLFPGKSILWGGIAIYIVLLLVSSIVFKRPVTTELLLIVGWAMLELSALNSLFGTCHMGRTTAVIMCIIVVAAAAASLICYMLYYRLSANAGYYTAMVPLITEAAVMAAICIVISVLYIRVQ